MPTPLLPLLLFACGAERGVREPPAEVEYSGWVYDGPAADEVVLAEGTVTFTVDGVEYPAAQPYQGYPGYWQATLPPASPFELRVESEDSYPTVWAGDTPSADGTWFAGALFSGRTDTVDTLLEGLDLPMGVVPGSLRRGAIHLWGVPADGSEWDCATVTVDGEAPLCFAADEDGALVRVTEGPFNYLFAFDLEPGEVTLEDGSGGAETWSVQEGDLVMAFWLVHG